jgi:hypothetical protein
MNSAKNIFGLILVGAIMALFVWLFDIRGIQTLIRQHRAESFPDTEGTILGAQIVTHTGSKGRIYYHPAFVYSYEVNGRSYRAGRYRYDGYPSDSASVRQIVNSHPVSSTVPVYYNPADPTDTCLAPKVVAHDVSPLFLMTPLTLIFLPVFYKAGRDINWPWQGRRVAGGVKIIRKMMKTHVRLPKYLPSLLALIAAAILSVIAGIVIQVDPKIEPLPASGAALGIILLGAVAVYCWQFLRLGSGVQDLIIDEGSRTIQLPLTFKRRHRPQLPFSDVKSVILKKIPHRGRYGVTYTYATTLQMQDGSAEKLADLGRNRAELFAAWLREKLGVPAQELTSMETS